MIFNKSHFCCISSWKKLLMQHIRGMPFDLKNTDFYGQKSCGADSWSGSCLQYPPIRWGKQISRWSLLGAMTNWTFSPFEGSPCCYSETCSFFIGINFLKHIFLDIIKLQQFLFFSGKLQFGRNVMIINIKLLMKSSGCMDSSVCSLLAPPGESRQTRSNLTPNMTSSAL